MALLLPDMVLEDDMAEAGTHLEIIKITPG